MLSLITRIKDSIIPIYSQFLVTENFLGDPSFHFKFVFVNSSVVIWSFNKYQYLIFMWFVALVQLVITFFILKVTRYCVNFLVNKLFLPAIFYVNKNVLYPAYETYILPRYPKYIEKRVKSLSRNSKIIRIKNFTKRLVSKVISPYVNAKRFLKQREAIEELVSQVEKNNGKIVSSNIKGGADSLVVSGSNTTALTSNFTVARIAMELLRRVGPRLDKLIHGNPGDKVIEKNLSIYRGVMNSFPALGAYKIDFKRMSDLENYTLRQLALEGHVYLIQTKSKAVKARVIVSLSEFLFVRTSAIHMLSNIRSPIINKLPSVGIVGWLFTRVLGLDSVSPETFKFFVSTTTNIALFGGTSTFCLFFGNVAGFALNLKLLRASGGLGVLASYLGSTAVGKPVFDFFVRHVFGIPGDAHKNFVGTEMFCNPDGTYVSLTQATLETIENLNIDDEVFFYNGEIKINSRNRLAYFLFECEEYCGEQKKLYEDAKRALMEHNLEIANSSATGSLDFSLLNQTNGTDQTPTTSFFNVKPGLYYGVPSQTLDEYFKGAEDQQLGNVVPEGVKEGIVKQSSSSTRRARLVKWGEWLGFKTSQSDSDLTSEHQTSLIKDKNK